MCFLQLYLNNEWKWLFNMQCSVRISFFVCLCFSQFSVCKTNVLRNTLVIMLLRQFWLLILPLSHLDRPKDPILVSQAKDCLKLVSYGKYRPSLFLLDIMCWQLTFTKIYQDWFLFGKNSTVYQRNFCLVLNI